MKPKHTPGPWKVMADPIYGKHHEYNAHRYIATADAKIKLSRYVPGDWCCEQGSQICSLRDGDTVGNAHLIAASPDLLRACDMALDYLIAVHNGEPLEQFCDIDVMEALADAIIKTKDETI